MGAKSPIVIISRQSLDLAYRALDDARCEIEAFEKHDEGYTASQKMMDRIEKAMSEIKELLSG